MRDFKTLLDELAKKHGCKDWNDVPKNCVFDKKEIEELLGVASYPQVPLCSSMRYWATK